MRFLSIHVEDIFAYLGPSHIDLSGCSDEQNIVVVQGRNGRGKTSLLNAIKLLFVGAEDERIRRVGFGGMALNPKHYVLGQPGRWFGVLNKHARAGGAPARVALEWEEQGQHFRAERLFWSQRNGADYREQLTVTRDRRELEPGDAHAILQHLIPKEVVPFFFFDGEQIQSLADAEVGREQAEIERLLGLSFLSHLMREIDTYARDKRRAGLPGEVQSKISIAEAQQKAAESRAEAAERARVAIEEEIADLEKEKTQLDSERDRLRGGVSEEEGRRVRSRIEILRHQRERLDRDIAEQLPVEAPALVNLRLVRRAFEMLQTQASGAADASLSARLHRDVPSGSVAALGSLNDPVQLSADQATQFRAAMGELLNACGVSPNSHTNPLLASLSPKDIVALRDRFLVWTESGASIAGTQAGLLRQIRQLAREEEQLRKEIDEAEITSDDARQRFQALSVQLAATESAIRDRIRLTTQHAEEETRARREVSQLQEQIARYYSEQAEVIGKNRAFQLARRTKLALESYRDERRKLIRASVEARLNEHVQVLLGPSQLVKEVRLSDAFDITYLNEQGDLVGRYSLSAGMRQLAAMSMLWALKDEARRPLPVVIDTPLGRIDRENRALLMSEYFPQAGNPLVLLPTNTEFGEDGYAQLSDRIARRYEIQNDDGSSARIIPLRGSEAA